MLVFHRNSLHSEHPKFTKSILGGLAPTGSVLIDLVTCMLSIYFVCSRLDCDLQNSRDVGLTVDRQSDRACTQKDQTLNDVRNFTFTFS